jgi:dolichol-phosphate mannosyltransferase
VNPTRSEAAGTPPGRRDGRTDGTDRRTDRRTDSRTDRRTGHGREPEFGPREVRASAAAPGLPWVEAAATHRMPLMRPLVVIPTYNESENIERMLHRIRECLPEAGVLVVDDGSPDGTAALVETVASELADVHLMRRSAKSGLGSAYRAGFAWGLERGYDAFVEIDADFSHDPAALPGLLAPLAQGYDVSIGSRYVEGGSIPNWAWHRHLLSRGGNVYADTVLGLGVRDSTAGFRAYTADILRALDLERIRAEGYGFQIEMTYRATQHGAAVCEVPISFVDRTAGESKMSSFIVVEALALVTWWGLARAWHALAGGGTRATAPIRDGSGGGSTLNGRRGDTMVGGSDDAAVSGSDNAAGSGTEHPVRSA